VGVVVGADPGVDVVLHDCSVSWEHCSVVPTRDGFLVTDLQSKNGTLLDGIQLSKALVPIGTLLRLGETILQLVPAEHNLELEPSSSDHFGELVGSSMAMRRPTRCWKPRVAAMRLCSCWERPARERSWQRARSTRSLSDATSRSWCSTAGH